ncbi:hypothetical protein MKX01_014139, partial [Papaver californicum]
NPKRNGHCGFAFVTFTKVGVAERVSRRTHEICGHQVAIDSTTPLDDAGSTSGGGNLMMQNLGFCYTGAWPFTVTLNPL